MGELNIPFIRERWVPALKNGEYIQGRSALQRQGCYCCLGVAIDLLKNELGLSWGEPDENARVRIHAGNETETDFLPLVVADYIGIERKGIVNLPTGACDLPLHNDTGGSFSDIAELLLGACSFAEAAASGAQS